MTKDKQYYFEDGTCAFQVDDHLFKIHQYLLTRESSFFENMFDLPQKFEAGEDRTEICEEECEGSSDDKPIICHDSVTSFQTLCWGLYLRPLEVRKQEDPAHVDLSRLISLTSIAHKYEFELLEKWAVATLREHWMNTFYPSGGGIELSWPLDTMMQLLALSMKTPDTIDQEFRATIESQWLSLSIDKIKHSNIPRVLDFIDDFSPQRVYGLTYYHVLRGFKVFVLPARTSSAQDNTGSPFPKLTPDSFLCPKGITRMMANVSPEHRFKLMHGFLRLVSIRGTNSLGQVQFDCTCKVPSPEAVPPPKRKVGSYLRERPDPSIPRFNCRLSWDTIWVSVCDTLDFGAMLEEALRRVNQEVAEAAFADTCKKELMAELQRLLASFEDNLVGYFTQLP